MSLLAIFLSSDLLEKRHGSLPSRSLDSGGLSAEASQVQVLEPQRKEAGCRTEKGTVGSGQT